MAFTNPWGTFSYNRMPFGLINAGAIFQRAMDLSFSDLKNRIIVIYLDDLTVFYKRRSYHLKDLEKVLQRCVKKGISLNPNKSIFSLTEGKLFGHIISKGGIKIDPDRVRVIQQLIFPSSKTGVKSFFGKVNFLRKFVPEFVEITWNANEMMKGKQNFRWNEQGKQDFKDIKEAIAQAHLLVKPDFRKDFIMYCYASSYTVTTILLQQNEESIESPISFMSISVKKHKINYSPIEKHAFSLVKAVKYFRFYIFHSHTIAFVPDPAVKSILTQQEVGSNKRGNWIARIHEYDLDLKPTKLVHEKGLCELMVNEK